MNNIFKEIDKLQKKINAQRPLSQSMLNQIKEYYRVGLTYSSNALEGNSLTETETKIVLEDGITIGGKPLRDHYEIIGHSEAFDLLYKLSKNNSFTEANIKELHRLFYRRIDEVNAGIYRNQRVIITGSKYSFPLPDQVEKLMKKFIKNLSLLKKGRHPIEYAALVHKEFVFIHPFIDGNGRLARLLMNLVLMQQKFNIVIIRPEFRAEYIRCLEKAHVDDKNFINFIARRLREAQMDYMKLLRIK